MMIKINDSELLEWIQKQEQLNTSFTDILSGIVEKIKKLEEVILKPEKVYPYDLSQAKITYAFKRADGQAYEETAQDALKNPKTGLTINEDGFTFDNEGDATTANSSGRRVEWRLYKNIDTKTNWQWDDDLVIKPYGVIFEKLSTTTGVYFGQIHGMTNAALLKLDAGKDQLRGIISRDDAGEDVVAHSFGVKPVIGKEYAIEFSRKGKVVECNLYEADRATQTLGKLLGTIKETNVYRTDEMYPKFGVYSNQNAKCTHFLIKK